MTDEQLLTDFLNQRDSSALEGLIRRYGPMVLRICRDVLDRPADAEDAFQATFLVLVRQAGSIRDRASIGRWLCEVAWRISRRERRKVARLRSQERQAQSMDPEAPPDSESTDRELRPILHEEIHRLPSKLREPILLCYFEGLSVEDAARRLQVPLGTIKSRLGRGRELLRSRLTRRGVAASVLLLLMFGLTEEVPAAVPGLLLSSTLEASLGQAIASRRVASMVLAEEARRRWVPSMAFWAFLVFLILGSGAIKLASARITQAGPEASIASLIFGSANSAKEHCQLHSPALR